MELKNKKTLIAFYSRKGKNWFKNGIVDLEVGNTDLVARQIQDLVQGDLFHIEAVHAYPDDYDACTEVAKVEFKTKARPALTRQIQDFGSYDVIFIGYPNWWGTMPMPVFTFIESYDFTGKMVIPFCTHEGSGMGHSEKDLAQSIPNARIQKGLAIRGSNAAQATSVLKSWLNEIEKTN